MFETDTALSTPGLLGLVGALRGLDTAVDDAERVDQIRALEQLKAAAQARVTAAFAASQEAAQRAAGVRRRDVGRGVAGQVGLAKRESPYRARRYVGWSRVLVAELPQTFAALQRGVTTEWRAMVVARESAWLSAGHRAVVDAELGARLHELGDRQTEAEARQIAYRLDPHGFLARSRGAESGRRVTVRPAPDAMARLTGLLPVAEAVAAYASLRSHADALVSQGDRRNRGRIMADTLVERVTGQAVASAVPVTVNLVMTDRALFNRHGDDRDNDNSNDSGADEPARLDGHGPIPADLARRLVADAPAGAGVWLRRLYTGPDGAALVAMDSRSRCFDHGLRAFLVLRDQIRRTPWCNAPIRHADHAVPASDGGPTDADNGQGLCEACDYAKQAPGWRARPGARGAGHTVVTTTPTGHRYTSRPPRPPGHRRRHAARAPTRLTTPAASHAEKLYRRLLAAA